MRVIGVCYFRNESDILEAFIRHTLAYCQTLLLLDHGSSDASPEIVHLLQREGLPLHLVSDPTLGHIEVEQGNRLCQLAAHEFSADWILSLDADEFIQGAGDSSFLPEDQVEPACLKIPMRSYYPLPEDSRSLLNPVERVTHRLASEVWKGDNPCEYKVIVPGALARKPGARLTQGKHQFFLDGMEAPFHVLNGVTLAHFSLRSPSQYATKLVARQLQKYRHIAKHGDEVGFYDEPYEVLRRSYTEFSEKFHDFRVAYTPEAITDGLVRDPLVYRGAPLLYTPRVPDADDVIRNLMDLGERLARSSEGPAVASDENAAAPARVSIELLTHPSPGHRVVRYLESGNGPLQTVVFPVDCPPDADRLTLCFISEQGLIEIRELALYFEGNTPARIFGKTEMQTMLRVLSGGAIITPSVNFRILASKEPVHLAIEGWSQPGGARPNELVLKGRFENRFLAPAMLSAPVLNAITADHNQVVNMLRKMESVERQGRAIYPGGCFEIDFKTKGNGALFTEQGWSWPESLGTWTDGDRATLRVYFPKAPLHPLWLHISARGFVSPAHPSLLAHVRINGESVADWNFNSPELVEHRVRLAAGKLRQGDNEISFDLDKPASPEALGISSDKRRLGIEIDHIAFHPDSWLRRLGG
jgi:hypothetical protein